MPQYYLMDVGDKFPVLGEVTSGMPVVAQNIDGSEYIIGSPNDPGWWKEKNGSPVIWTYNPTGSLPIDKGFWPANYARDGKIISYSAEDYIEEFSNIFKTIVDDFLFSEFIGSQYNVSFLISK